MKRLLIAAACLASTSVLAQAPTPATPPPYPQVPYMPDFAAPQEGKPLETRPSENVNDKPSFPGQTRAPYHKTAPYKLTEITGKLEAPWGLGFLPDGKFLVTERLPGRLRIVGSDGSISQPVAGLEQLAGNWPTIGLFDLALDPGYAKNHRIYFTFFGYDHGMISGIQVARAVLNEQTNALSDVKVIFRAVPQTPNDARSGVGTRSGGRLEIGPDGLIYITIGDRDTGSAFPWRVAQTLDTDLGKIIRITRDGKAAPGNPFVKTPGALPEIWAIGQRSQEGLAFDNQGRLWETEHGPRGGDELNLIKKGANYGWPLISHGIDYPGPAMGNGQVSMPGMEEPVYYWAPSMGPAGLAFYKGNLFPEWKNSAFVATLRGQGLERLEIRGDRVVNEEPLLTDVKMRLRTVKVGPDGAVYVLTDSGGTSITENTPPTSKLLKLTPR